MTRLPVLMLIGVTALVSWQAVDPASPGSPRWLVFYSVFLLTLVFGLMSQFIGFRNRKTND